MLMLSRFLQIFRPRSLKESDIVNPSSWILATVRLSIGFVGIITVLSKLQTRPLTREKTSRIFLILRRESNLIRVNVVLSSARPSLFDVSLFDSNLKMSGSKGLRIGTEGTLGTSSIDGSSSILKIKICMQKLKVLGEMLSP